jgi:hypothetical protein
LENRLRHLDIEPPGVDVEHDHIALFDGRDRSTTCRLGGYMAGHKAAGGAAEAPVREERHRFTEARPYERASDPQHLAHTRAAAGAFIPDDDDVTRVDHPLGDGVHGVLFAVEHPRPAAMVDAIIARDFDHTSLGRQVALQNHQPARGLERIRQGAHYVLTRRFHGGIGLFTDGTAGDGHLFRIQEPCLEQAFGDEGNTASALQIDRGVTPARLQISQQRRARADGVEVIDR